MLSVSSPNMSKEYALKVVAFVNKVFSTYRENLEERSCKNLALSVVELSDYTYPELYAWLEFLLLGLYKGDKGCTRYRHPCKPTPFYLRFSPSHGSSVLRYIHWKLDLADTDLAENLGLKDTL